MYLYYITYVLYYLKLLLQQEIEIETIPNRKSY